MNLEMDLELIIPWLSLEFILSLVLLIYSGLTRKNKMFNKYDSFIFDLDGTIYTENKLILNADKTINHLKDIGKKVVFISNKTTGSSYDYYLLLKSFNINVEPEEIINASVVIKKYLKKNFPGKNFF